MRTSNKRSFSSSETTSCSNKFWRRTIGCAAVWGVGLLFVASVDNTWAQSQRLLGIDVSAWQGNLSQTTWNNLRTVENRQFAIIRSSRGGTTGYYNQNDSGNVNGQNTLSQRYDDPYFIQNINRATTAGLYAGSYHFSRPDIIEGTLNSDGIPNNGVDEANHFIQMAGPWMRPGYLVPVHDFEAGDGARTDEEMAQFCLDFSSRIYEVMGIRPAIYTSGNYAANILGGASAASRDLLAKPAAMLPSVVSPAYPTLWSARWPNQADPNSIDVQNGEPKDSYPPIYGPWDDYGTTHPWQFWQYASTARLPSYSTTRNLDVDVVRGGFEFLKDQLVPAVWTHNSSGEWHVLTNWNSGRAPVTPVTGPGQVAPVATGPLPTPRLPGAAGTGVSAGQNDTVILERPDANITVTVSQGSYNIRKLYMREALNISGGSLSINYVPVPDSTPHSAQFSGPVTLSGAASLQAHTLQVDAGRTFALNGGILRFNTLKLIPSTGSPGRLVLGGNVAVAPLSDANATIANGTGTGSSGYIDLGAATRTISVSNGASDVDLSLIVPLSNGGLVKSGPGTMALYAASTYSGGTTVSGGRLLVNNNTGSSTGSGAVTVGSGGVLSGSGRISGALSVQPGGTVAPGTTSALGTIAIGSSAICDGTNLFRISRNGGTPAGDKIVLSTGILTCGGTLVVTNTGDALGGGEKFFLFSAPAYAGSIVASEMPSLNPGLNWYLGNLLIDGSVRVNRRPIANNLTISNTPGEVLQIPIALVRGAATDLDGDTIALSGIDATSTNGVPITADAEVIYYRNDANVADGFAFTISDGAGGTASASIAIAPGYVRPFITAHPQSRTNAIGTDAQFSVVATGTSPLSYQWRFNDVDIPSAIHSSYTRPAVQPSDAGSYSVVVSNIAGMVTSSTAGLIVLQPVPARFEFFTLLPDGRFHFRVKANPGRYAIDATTNFLVWDELTNVTSTTDLFEFTDENTNFDCRGYRTRSLPPAP